MAQQPAGGGAVPGLGPGAAQDPLRRLAAIMEGLVTHSVLSHNSNDSQLGQSLEAISSQQINRFATCFF